MQYELVKPEIFLERVKKNSCIDYECIKKAVDFTIVAHHNQKRDSGEDYVIHPLNVALILLEMKFGTSTIIAGLLHDVIEDTKFTKEEINELFGSEVAFLVDGVTKLVGVNYRSNIARKKIQAENFRRFLLSLTQDVRVLAIKLADRLHNMRTLTYVSKERQIRIANETLDIYTPLANLFGFAKIRWELEDLSFKYSKPEIYSKIVKMVAEKKVIRDEYINSVIPLINDILKTNDIKAEIFGRSKHFYSIYRKNIVRKVPYDEIYDLAAIRIIVSEISECYQTLGLIHNRFEPFNIVKDYIARPKPNGYQSLHTIVLGPKGKKIEIQIRTKKMNFVAEEGIAAHWRYKEFNDYSEKGYRQEINKSKMQKSFERQISEIRSILKNNSDISKFNQVASSQIKNLYKNIIIVLSPKGDYYKLPNNSSTLDFAFAVHTDIGFYYSGAKINGKIANLGTKLKSGDVVEILTANKPTLNKDWIKYLHTNRAQNRVKSYLRRKEIEASIKLGKDILFKKLGRKSIELKENQISDLLIKFHIKDHSTFYSMIGFGKIQITDIVDELRKEKKINQKDEKSLSEKEWIASIQNSISGIKINDIENVLFRFAKCCNPVPGDSILGFITRGRGISIHKINCKEGEFLKAIKEKSDRIIPITWDFSSKNIANHKTAEIKINSIKINNFFLEIFKILSKLKIEVLDSKLKNLDYHSEGVIRIMLKAGDEKKIMKRLRSLKGVTSVVIRILDDLK
jgi:GTP pyrophosphokinase